MCCSFHAQALHNLFNPFLNFSYFSAIVSGISSGVYCLLLAYGSTSTGFCLLNLFSSAIIAGSNPSPATLPIDTWNKTNALGFCEFVFKLNMAATPAHFPGSGKPAEKWKSSLQPDVINWPHGQLATPPAPSSPVHAPLQGFLRVFSGASLAAPNIENIQNHSLQCKNWLVPSPLPSSRLTHFKGLKLWRASGAQQKHCILAQFLNVLARRFYLGFQLHLTPYMGLSGGFPSAGNPRRHGLSARGSLT